MVLWSRVNFNPRTREGCDFLFNLSNCLMIKFQSTHPRRVRHNLAGRIQGETEISIHAPAKGATNNDGRITIAKKDFNPRTREGCDKATRLMFTSLKNFNPRTREGCDTYSWDGIGSYSDFNPRTREGCDMNLMQAIFTTFIFQSTHPRRVRQLQFGIKTQLLLISIHAPAKGATNKCREVILGLIISIHAPAKGATKSIGSTMPSHVISIHAPAKGATVSFILALSCISISIHAPAKGATVSFILALSCISISIHAPAKGATFFKCKICVPKGISIHAPAKGATF